MTSFYEKWLKKQALVSTTQPLSSEIESNDKDYLSDIGYKKIGWRNFRRKIQFLLSGQNQHLRHKIDPTWKRGLWIYKGIPQIGDALMDLAPRSLLQKQGLRIDLYTDHHLAVLFDGDPWFDKVYDNPKKITCKNYDFVIIPSHKRRSLKYKFDTFPETAWISIHEFYTGPEFHRGKFAAQRIIDLLDNKTTTINFAWHQQQKLIPLFDSQTENNKLIKIAYAMGGVDKNRTYSNWSTFTRELIKSNIKFELTLLGSENATTTANEFANEFNGNLKIVNKVNKTGITECRKLIHQQDILITADGGLMHLGSTTKVKLISLFHAKINPCWRLSGVHLQSALQSTTNSVSDIASADIVQTCIRLLIDKTSACSDNAIDNLSQ
jgi:ADP-heptose:LPS heptosyltransferase